MKQIQRKRASGGLERMELDLGLHPSLGLRLGHRLYHNGARQSQPPSRSVDDCEIPLPLSCLINDGGSGFGDFVGAGLLTDRWVW